MAPDSSSPGRSPARLLILFGVVLLTGSLLIGYLLRTSTNETAESLPRSIAGYTLTRSSYGSAAIAEIARMHGREFPTTFGAMGIYGDANQVSLWIEGFQDKSTATKILNEMMQKIALGNSPFLPGEQKQDGNRAVNQLDGIGQKHIYFQSGSLVVWLAADPQVAYQAIPEILEDYP